MAEQDAAPAHASGIEDLSPELRADMAGVSWHEGCPVALDDLRVVTVLYWGMDGAAHAGQLVVHKDVAQEVAAIFGDLYAARFPIERMHLIEAYGGSDDASMADNNTSAFNCRTVPGSTTLSRHSLGVAIDVNPLLNPYVRGDTVLPPQGAAYVERDPSVPGVIVEGDACWQAFTSRGWQWGGSWVSLKDYQHFDRELE